MLGRAGSASERNLIPKLVHQTARTKDLAWEERRLADRIQRILFDWEYRLWDNDEQRALFHQLFPELANRFDKIPFGVARSDLARYAILYLYGGVYVDIDYRLLRYVDKNISHAQLVLPIELYNQSNPDKFRPIVIGNSFLAAAPKQLFWKNLIEDIFDKLAPDRMASPDQIVSTTGPVALTDFYERHKPYGSEVLVAEKNLFQPNISFLGLRSSADKETYGVHLHWGSWRRHSPLTAIRILLRRKLNALVS